MREIQHEMLSLQDQWTQELRRLQARRSNRAVPDPRTTPPQFDQHKSVSPPPLHTPQKPQKEWTPQRVQNLLLWIGAALCVTAALLFIGFAWDRLGLGGRAAVLVGLTSITGLLGFAAFKRGLTATSESISTVAVMLALIDAWAIRHLDVGGTQDISGFHYWALVLCVFSALLTSYRLVVPITTIGVSAVIAAQLPLPLVLIEAETELLPASIAFGAQVLLSLIAAYFLRRQPVLPDLLKVFAGGIWLIVTMIALVVTLTDGSDSTATHLLNLTAVLVMSVTAGLAGIGGIQLRSTWGRRATTTALGLLAMDSFLAGIVLWHGNAIVLPVAVCALILTGIAWTVRAQDNTPERYVAGITAAVASIGPGLVTLQAIAGQWHWLENVWTMRPGTSATESISQVDDWTGDGTALLVAGLVALAAYVIGVLANRRDIGTRVVLVAGAIGLQLVPLVTDAPYGVGVGTTLLIGLAAVFSSRLHPPFERHRNVLTTIGVIALVQTLTWSLASNDATVITLFVVLLAAVVLAVLDTRSQSVSVPVAAATGIAWTYAITQFADWPRDRAGFAAVLVSALVVLTMDALRPVKLTRVTRDILAIACGIGAVTATAVAVGDLGWLTWCLTTLTVATAGLAAGRERRYLLGPAFALSMAATAAATHLHDWSAGLAGFLIVLIAGAAGTAGTKDKSAPSFLLGVALFGALIGFSFASDDAGWTAWTFLAAAAGAALMSMEHEFRHFRWVSSLFAIGSLWTRLGMSDIETVEAYSVPLAAVVLFAGWRARTRQPALSSWAAYGAGLALAFGPSLIILNDGESLVRPGLFAFAALATVLIGSVRRLRAPLVVGSACLLIDALVQFGPALNHVPRWVTVGFIGSLLLFVGATYERRLRDARSLRQRYETLG